MRKVKKFKTVPKSVKVAGVRKWSFRAINFEDAEKWWEESGRKNCSFCKHFDIIRNSKNDKMYTKDPCHYIALSQCDLCMLEDRDIDKCETCCKEWRDVSKAVNNEDLVAFNLSCQAMQDLIKKVKSWR